jgi:hypothetical protein
MLAADPAPGVRFELADPPRPLAETRTDVAGFVGFARRGPLHAPLQVESWTQYEAAFGGFGGGGYLPYAVHAFFENGGRTAYVVRVAVPPDDSDVAWEARARSAWTHVPLSGPAGEPRLEVEARTPGRWGNGIAVEVVPSGGAGMEAPRLTVRVTDRGGMTWRLADTSLDPEDARWLPRVAEATAGLPVRIRVVPDVPPPGPGETGAEYLARVPRASAARRRLRGGRDGTAACTREHLLGGATEPADRWGLETLRVVDDVALLAVPDASAFPERADAAPPEAAPVPCTVLEVPPDDGLRFRLPERATPWTIAEAAALLGTTPARLRQANPGLGATIPPGSVLRLPVPHSARADDPRVEDTSPYWPDGAGAAEVRTGMERLALEHGLTLHELLAANPAYHPVLAADPAWRASAVPVVIPEPPPETPPRWSWADTRAAAEALIALCEARRDCVALLDPPATAETPSAAEAFRAELPDTPAAGLYWPWLVAEAAPRAGGAGRLAATLAVPPSGFVAGMTAAADLAVGPHRTPAGQTARRALATAAPVEEEPHGRLNARGVNAFRERPGRGVVLEGARSLARGGPWRWLNARRVFLAIAEELEERTAWAVFEPAGPLLWATLRDQVRASLTRRWRRGSLMGTSPDDAFYVRCDEATNPPEEQEAGRVITLIGLRMPPPIEWIEVRIGRSAQGLEVLDVSRAS